MTGRKKAGKSERTNEREREIAYDVVVTFESIRVTEWNESSIDQRRVGSKGAAAAANRTPISSERGRRRARGTGRGDETDGPTHVRSLVEPRYAYAFTVHVATSPHTELPRVIRTCVRARVFTLTRGHRSRTRAYGAHARA